ncbi:hypothetical protein L917_06847, partial [Phytophthora nicotianae]
TLKVKVNKFQLIAGFRSPFVTHVPCRPEVKITLAKLLSQFDFKSVKDPFDFTYRASITLQVKGSFDVVV